jgi:hypothetical protein
MKRSSATGQYVPVVKRSESTKTYFSVSSKALLHGAASKTQVETIARSIMRGFAYKAVRKGKNWVVVPDKEAPPKKKMPVLVGSGIPSEDVKSELPWATDEQLEKVSDEAALLSSEEFSDRVQISRETAHRWRRDGKVIGFEMAKRGFRFPAEQLDGRGRPLDGIAELVRELDNDHWAAWRFLREPVPELGGMTGFALLSDGKLDALLRVLAARAHGSFG